MRDDSPSSISRRSYGTMTMRTMRTLVVSPPTREIFGCTLVGSNDIFDFDDDEHDSCVGGGG
jgi:hypothetical protein